MAVVVSPVHASVAVAEGGAKPHATTAEEAVPKPAKYLLAVAKEGLVDQDVPS